MGILRRWFGPSKAETWRQLSEEMGAQYEEARLTKADKIVASHGEWSVTLDTFVVSAGKTYVTYTRLRAPYVNPDGFRFSVRRKHALSALGKLLGMQDVEVGHADFDRDFVIKGTDESRLRTLFANDAIRRLIQAQPQLQFEVKDDEGYFGTKFPEGVDELYFAVVGVIKDPDRLYQLFELFAETLDELCRMGSAYEGGTLPTLQ